jgi:hypothetical protein
LKNHRIAILTENDRGQVIMAKEVILATAPVSSQLQVRIKNAVQPFLDVKEGDRIEFVLTEKKEILIRKERQ